MNKKLVVFIIIFLTGLGVGFYYFYTNYRSNVVPRPDAPLSVQNMFKSPVCKAYKQASKYYYSEIQKQFDAVTVKDIINGKALTRVVAKKQAAIAADAINKNCDKKVSSDYPFCCDSDKPNSKGGSCIACNLVNRTLCDLIGRADCTNAVKKYGIDFCKLEGDQCVYNGDPSSMRHNTDGCNKNSQGCFYKPPSGPPEPPSYKWDCLNDPCYKDSIKAGNCDILSKRQLEHCTMIPRHTDNTDNTVVYCATRANAMNAVSGDINPKCSPYAR